MRVFMLGWEFPPFISGGLGTACYGLTKAMSKLGLEVLFALPKTVGEAFSTHVKMLTPQDAFSEGDLPIEIEELENIQLLGIKSLLKPYSTPKYYQYCYEEAIKSKRHSAMSMARAMRVSISKKKTIVVICFPRFTVMPLVPRDWR